MGSIIADGTEKKFGRIKGNLGFTFILKSTDRTTIGLGAMGFIDPSEQFPALPIFMLKHKFRNSKWELDLLIPDGFNFQRPVGENGRLSLGAKVDCTGFYIENKGPGESLLEYSQLGVKTGFTYEHRLNSFLIASFKGGVQNLLDNKLMEKGDGPNDEIYTNSQKMTGYFQVGISILPW